jgi:AcrR family transcriptional regulator
MNDGVAPRPGRPTRAQAAAISKTILGAATELFLNEGFEGASIEAIAARAKVPRSTVYKRYIDKTGLLRAVIRTHIAGLSVMASKHDPDLPTNLPARLEVRAAWMLITAGQPEIRAFSRLAASAWPEPADIRERLDVSGYTQMVDLIERDIRELGPDQGLAAADPRWVAEALMALLFGWVETAGDIAPDAARAFAQRAVALLIDGRAAW